MPEIYCFDAPTPYAHTWPDVEARGEDEEYFGPARGKRERRGEGLSSRTEGEWGESRRARGRERVELRSLSILFPLSSFVRGTMAR